MDKLPPEILLMIIKRIRNTYNLSRTCSRFLNFISKPKRAYRYICSWKNCCGDSNWKKFIHLEDGLKYLHGMTKQYEVHRVDICHWSRKRKRYAYLAKFNTVWDDECARTTDSGESIDSN